MPVNGILHQEVLFYKNLFRGSRVLVAVSGGADSVALLVSLNQLQHELGMVIGVAHFDHALRTTSSRDRRFVEALSKSLDLPFLTEINLKKLPKKGSVEDFARGIRYDFLVRAARRFKADAVILAHTKDDVAETVLLRVLRGTGLSGLSSISATRTYKGVVFLRPFLRVSRKEIEAFLKKVRQKFINDPTNRSRDFDRNKVRLDLIPFLERSFALDIKDRLSDLARTSRDDHAFLEEMAGKLLKKIGSFRKGGVFLDHARYLRQHPSMRRMLLRLAAARVKPDPRSWPLAHIDRMDAFLAQSNAGQLSLPEGVSLSILRGTFALKSGLKRSTRG